MRLSVGLGPVRVSGSVGSTRGLGRAMVQMCRAMVLLCWLMIKYIGLLYWWLLLGLWLSLVWTWRGVRWLALWAMTRYADHAAPDMREGPR
jgi:hypothetical protein